MGMTRDGGKPNVKPIPYSPPTADVPMRKGPGLGGDNHGCGQQGSSEHMKGRPGIGGQNKGVGSQR